MYISDQFYEQATWGAAGGTPESDPNLHLEAYVEAARRGATARILLNSFAFAEYENENVDSVAYVGNGSCAMPATRCCCWMGRTGRWT